MPIQRHSISVLIAVLCAVLATAFLIACQQSQPSGPGPEPKTATSDVYVIFEGPWAIVPDPKDPNNVLAIAPKTKSHRSLAVTPANTTLETGVYEVSVPPHGPAHDVDGDKGFLRVKVDPKNVQQALDSKMERYVVRLPKPEAYRAETRYESRVDSKYPPDPSTQQNYVTAVSLVYSVTSKAGFSLAGNRDAGESFKPALLPLDTPVIRFAIDPAESAPADGCSGHSRGAFRDLVRLLGLTLYVDFPGDKGKEGDKDDCHKKDPQLAGKEKAQVIHGVQAWESESEHLPPIRAAGMAGILLSPRVGLFIARIESRMAAALYFFNSDSGACRAPIIFGGG